MKNIEKIICKKLTLIDRDLMSDYSNIRLCIKGTVANWHQLCSVFALGFYIHKRYSNLSIAFKVDYHRFWKSNNIDLQVLEYLNSIVLGTEDNNNDNQEIEIDVAVNNSFDSDKVVIDDGIGAYRKNVFESLRMYQKESEIINNEAIGMKNSIRFLLKRCVYTVHDFFSDNKFSYFRRKGFFGYFDRMDDVIECFFDVYQMLSVASPKHNVEIEAGSYVYISSPAVFVGAVEEDKYISDLKSLFSRHKVDLEKLYILKHPLDDFDYEKHYSHAKVISNRLPAEAIIYNNNENIKLLLGSFSSTLLYAAVSGYNFDVVVDKSMKRIISREFWVLKAYKRYTRIS